MVSVQCTPQSVVKISLLFILNNTQWVESVRNQNVYFMVKKLFPMSERMREESEQANE